MIQMTANANLFADIPPDLQQEQIDQILASPVVRIERIVSRGHASADGFWYDQDWHEWVSVLAGSAGVLFEGEDEPRTLRAGDHLLIPAHQRHRIVWTDPNRATIWLAVHYRP